MFDGVKNDVGGTFVRILWFLAAAASTALLSAAGIGVFGIFEQMSGRLRSGLVTAIIFVGISTAAAPIRDHITARRLSRLQEQMAAAEVVDNSRHDLRKLAKAIHQITVADAPTSADPHGWSVVALLVTDDGDKFHRITSFSPRPPSKTQIQFAKGKGVVGQALQTGKSVTINLDASDIREAIQSKHPDKWEALGDGRRMGLTHAEAQQITGYSTVLATPVFAKNEPNTVVGVISVTGPSKSFNHLKKVRGTIATTAANAATPFRKIANAQRCLNEKG